MIEVLGHIGAILLAVSSLPQFIKTVKEKDVSGLSLTTLLFWSFGCILTGIYVALTSAQLPLLLNYTFNAIIVSATIFLYFKYKKK